MEPQVSSAHAPQSLAELLQQAWSDTRGEQVQPSCCWAIWGSESSTGCRQLVCLSVHLFVFTSYHMSAHFSNICLDTNRMPSGT
ncbi:hypothetical protein PoB_005921000 [Plakobranchus ocellatus]|uniref:Uncharacterized protein n=1 Tax=Plakobranchus ocellatus TaxID=259542 RepID=A0AAV4CL79_9GAST|nr:hypothetical protein PoB_005921000 [Plakobranchus ocellatus]